MSARAREDVESLLDELRVHLEWAKIPEPQINVATGFHYRIDHFVRAYDWLHTFSMSPAYTEFKRVFALRPLTIWQNYESMGLTGLREQVMLEEAGRKLKKRWNVRRPRMFGPDRKVDEDAEQETDSEDSE